MKQDAQGFTLIEMMIAIAIIGILLAVALPLYQDYSARAQAATALQSLNGVKMGVLNYYYNEGQCTGADVPYQNDIDVLVNTEAAVISNVSISETSDNCKILSVFAPNALPNLRGKKLEFTILKTASGASGGWVCTSPDLDPKYLPPACRSQC